MPLLRDITDDVYIAHHGSIPPNDNETDYVFVARRVIDAYGSVRRNRLREYRSTSSQPKGDAIVAFTKEYSEGIVAVEKDGQIILEYPTPPAKEYGINAIPSLVFNCDECTMIQVVTPSLGVSLCSLKSPDPIAIMYSDKLVLKNVPRGTKMRLSMVPEIGSDEGDTTGLSLSVGTDMSGDIYALALAAVRVKDGVQEDNLNDGQSLSYVNQLRMNAIGKGIKHE